MKPGLELIFEVDGELYPPIEVGPTPQGMRRVVPIARGRFEGPDMCGEVMPGGADWQFVRSDGVWELEALYLLRTDDGMLIQVRNRGIRHGPEHVMRRLMAGDPVDPAEYYFRAAPVFSAPAGRYDWLNRSIFVCTGARSVNGIRLWFYRVT